MGGSDYDREVYSVPTPAAAGRAPAASAGFSAAASQVLSQRGLHQDMDPRGRTLTCQAKSPVVVAIDVTGSMGNWTKIIYDKLPMFYGQLKMQGYLEDPSISFAAVGDHASDCAPLQAGDFAQGLAIDDMVAKIWLEGLGGGNKRESYELAAHYYASDAVRFPAATSKPFFFFTGDEGCYDAVESKGQLQWLPFGTEPVDAKRIFKRLREKYHVFLLKKPYRDASHEVAIMQQWRDLIGQDRILMLTDPKAVVDIMLGVIAAVTGARTTEEFVADLVERGQTEERRADVRRMLQQVENATRMDPAVQKPRRWRRCAAGVVFNERGEVLLGERLGEPGSWQLPQGGLDGEEKPSDAAARELYEEVGLSHRLQFISELPASEECCYEADGWLRKAGYDGQQLLFSLFFLQGFSEDPSAACDIRGLSGEKPEFSAVRWGTLAEAAGEVWAPKRPAYRYLERHARERIRAFLRAAAEGDPPDAKSCFPSSPIGIARIKAAAPEAEAPEDVLPSPPSSAAAPPQCWDLLD